MGRLHVRLSDDLEKKLELLAERLETTKSGVVKQLIDTAAGLVEKEQQQGGSPDLTHAVFYNWRPPEIGVVGPLFSPSSSLTVRRPNGLPHLIPRGKLAFIRVDNDLIDISSAGFNAIVHGMTVHDVKIQIDGFSYRPDCNLEVVQRQLQSFLFLHPPFRLDVEWHKFDDRSLSAPAVLTRVDVLTGDFLEEVSGGVVIDSVAVSATGPHIHGAVTTRDGERLGVSINGIHSGVGQFWTYRSGEGASLSLTTWVTVNPPESWQQLADLSQKHRITKLKKSVKRAADSDKFNAD